MGGGLRLEQVSKTRPTPEGPREILCDLTWTIPAAGISVLIGPSGAGKTTLLRLLNRLEDPTTGRILIDGRDLAAIPPLDLRRRIGLVPQKPFMFPGTVLENLQASFHLTGRSAPDADDEGMRDRMAAFHLPAAWLPRPARALSLGEQQRVGLVRALLAGPDVLLLDEPTSALDRPTGDGVALALRRLSREEGVTQVMIHHDLRLAGRVADRLAFLEGGRLVEEGPADDLLSRPESEGLRRFLADTREGE